MVITAEEKKILRSELLKMSRVAREVVNKLLIEHEKQNCPENFSLENLKDEIWHWVKGYENIYQISNLARVKSFQKGKVKILQPILNNSGYLSVRLYKNGKSKVLKVHRLVAENFIPNPKNKPEVDHIDGCKINNAVENLRWVTSSENTQAALETGALKTGSENPNSKLTADDVKYIRSVYKECDEEFGAKALAKKFNISYDTIYNIIKNIVYTDVE